MLTHTRAGEVWESDALIMGDYFTHDFQVGDASFSHQMYLSLKTHGNQKSELLSNYLTPSTIET